MSQAGQTRRRFERYDLRVPATVEFGEMSNRIQLSTRDISAGGAFFHSAQPLEQGIKVKIELVLTNNTLQKLTGTQSKIKVYGIVVGRDCRQFQRS